MGLLSVSGVQVDITGNLAPLRRDLQAAERELGAFSRRVSGTGTGAGTGSFSAATTSAHSFFGSLRSGAQDIFFMTNAASQMYAAFSKPFRAADDLAQMGYAAERARIALTNATGSAAEYERWIRAVKTATHGTVTETEAAGLAYQSLRLGLARSADEAQEFVRVATIIGAASPQLSGVGDAISEISLTIANMSWRRLDQLGLSVTETKARMEELMALNSDLSKEEAFQQSVMEGLTQQANMLGDELLEVGAKTQRWKIEWNELKTDIGWKIGQGFDSAIYSAETLVEVMHTLSDDPWKIRIIAEMAGFPQWAIDALEAASTGQGDITNRYDAALGRQQSQIRGGMYPALPGSALAPSGVPPVAIPNPMDLAALEQAQLAGVIVPPELMVDIERYYEEYYAAQERAQTAAFQKEREQFENRLLRMYGTGGGADIAMLISGLILRGSALAPEVKRDINDYYTAYYAAQEDAALRARAQADQRMRVTQYRPGSATLGAGALELPATFPRSPYGAAMTQHGMPGTQFFPAGLGLPTDRSGRPVGYQDWYWEQYYTRGGWQGGGLASWEIDPTLKATRERLAALRAERQLRAFRAAEAASMAEVYPGGGAGRYAGLSPFMGMAGGLMTMFDAAEMARQQQLLADWKAARAPAPRAESLEEQFGIAPDRIDVEVLSLIEGKLDDLGVTGDEAAEAMRYFEYQTGQVTGTAELFDYHLDLLAERLKTGELNSVEFADQLARLSQTDLSGLNKMFEPFIERRDWGGLDQLLEGLEKLSLNQLIAIQSAVEHPPQEWWKIGPETGIEIPTRPETGTGLSPLQQLADDAFAARDALQIMSDEGVGAAETFATEATGWFETWSSDSLTYVDTLKSGLDEIEAKIAHLTMAPFVVTLKVNEPGGGGGGGNSGGVGQQYGIGEWATGGYTGDGPAGEVAGLVHRGEYVVPRGGALVLDRKSESGGPTIIVQQLNTFGDWRGAVRQLEQAARDAGYRLVVR